MKFTIAINMERLSPQVDMQAVARHTLEMAQMAEDGGFDIVWVGEHYTIEPAIGSAPFQLLAHIAAHTSHVRLGTACVVAPYWHPIKLAGEAAMFDLLSGGRLELGIGRGAYQWEFDRLAGGIPQERGVAYMKELLPALKGLWQGDYENRGEFWPFPVATSVPKPLQKPYPRIWIAARDSGTYDWAIANGCSIQSWPIARPFSELEVYLRRFEDALRKNPGRTRPDFLAMRHTAVYDRLDGWEIPVETVIRRSALFEGMFRNLGRVVNGFPEAVDLNDLGNREEYTAENLRENLIFGRPDEVVRKLQRYETAGVDYFCYMASYGLPMDYQKNSLSLFCKEVIPAFAQEQRAVVVN
jgi:alkanesulfonate monooxygenase SsuD/methylene tetrahydromethanopterin reductase-like flavin-dependent oxidoreductase (luciferase family)